MQQDNRELRHCQKCGWEWFGKKTSKQCPHCRTFNWNKKNEFIKKVYTDKLTKQEIEDVKKMVKLMCEQI
jgi:uncharacterized Zn finger protein (UPF0148 family)